METQIIITKELQNILNVLDRIEEKANDSFYAQIKNALRIYYLGINTVFITDRVLKNADLLSLNINDGEKVHIENAGWLLDQNYVNDVYVGALKTNLILDVWLVFKSNNKIVSFKDTENDFLEWYEILIRSLNNDSKGVDNKEIVLNGDTLSIKKEDTMDFITLEVVLSLVNKVVETYRNINASD